MFELTQFRKTTFRETVRGPMSRPVSSSYRAPGSRWNPDSQLSEATQLTTSQLIRSCHSWRSKPVIHSERDWFVDVTGAVMPGSPATPYPQPMAWQLRNRMFVVARHLPSLKSWFMLKPCVCALTTRHS